VTVTDAETRRILRSEIVRRLQTLTTESRHVAQAFASQQGLTPTDLDALLHVLHEENTGTPTTPGGIADTLGLTSGAATGVIDRLERQGHVVRSRDEHDRRLVRVHYGDEGMKTARDFFTPLGRVTDEVMAGFTDDELAVVTRFLQTMSEAMQQHAESVTRGDPA
jgi:DNA-binding MarR family transcriptional regulator